MAHLTLNRYIWILNTLIKHRELTFEEIAERWSESELCNGKPMALRTFHDHRKAILELFGVEIKCNTSNGYRYYVGSLDSLRQDKFRNWLFNSFSLSNMLQTSQNLKDRILFENLPKGTEYLPTIIEAMREGKALELDYQRFGGESRETFHIEVYALKMYHLRWYILGNIREREGLRHLSLDRILEVKLTKEKYTIPENFDAEKYYANSIGIYVDPNLAPQKVRIRAYGNQVEYLRTLPLHKSQEEVLTKHHQYSEFQYRLCLTPELTTQILSMGNNAEVLEPQELREKIHEEIQNMFNRYN
ncbi:MAG: WYL domain-containing protein [Bacteroidaceae bacterium]|nr:WYL domain-containing protein [Bacteroidaceae bacterium]